MKKKIFLSFLAFLLLFSPVAGLDVHIREDASSCKTGEEAMVSINSTTGGHVAKPGYYGIQVCVEGEEDFTIQQKCDVVRTFSLFSKTNSHLSMFSVYRYGVCSQTTRAAVRTSCQSDEVEALSVTGDNNTHVAAPGYSGYPKSLCLFREEPENITLKLTDMKGSEFYADNSAIDPGETLRLVEYPYIISTNGQISRGIVSYGGFVKLSRPSTSSISLTQTSSTFLLPFTSGGRSDIEDDEDKILSNRFLNQLSPSFHYVIPEEPVVKIIRRPDHKVKGFGELISNEFKATVENKGLKGSKLVIDISED